MTILDIKISLPDNLRSEAEKAGLLTPRALERLLREELRRRKVEGLFAAADRLSGLDVPVLSEEEIETEIAAVRHKKIA